MALFNIWTPDDSQAAPLEIPIRTPHSPANLWVHWSGLCADWAGFPPTAKNGDWHRGPGLITAVVNAGDKVLAGQASLGLSSAHREEQGLFDTDDWGMAIDSVVPLTGTIEGPGAVSFAVSFATLGNCWPVGVALTVDLLILRSSLVPATPAPYGEPPKRVPRVRDRVDERAAFAAELERISARAVELKQLLETDRTQDVLPELRATIGPNRSLMGISMALAAPLTPDCPSHARAPRDPDTTTQSPRDKRHKQRG
jgi:hypothetical protein